MDCEAANTLQGIQDQMVMLSRDPTIKIPVWGYWASLFYWKGYMGYWRFIISSIWVIWTFSWFPVLDHLTRDCSMPKAIASTKILSLLDAFLSILNLSVWCVYTCVCPVFEFICMDKWHYFFALYWFYYLYLNNVHLLTQILGHLQIMVSPTMRYRTHSIFLCSYMLCSILDIIILRADMCDC